MKDRIKNLLASGLKPTEISTIVGCSPSYISQLISSSDFKEEVQQLVIANQTEKTEEEHLDKRYQNLEHKILNNIEQELANAEFPHLLKALEVVTKRGTERLRVKLPPVSSSNQTNNIHITNIALPAHALSQPAPVVEVNEKNEIIAIDAKPLAPMSSTGVKNIFSQIAAAKKLAIQTEAAKVLEQL